jgi:hypothetical protein
MSRRGVVRAELVGSVTNLATGDVNEKPVEILLSWRREVPDLVSAVFDRFGHPKPWGLSRELMTFALHERQDPGGDVAMYPVGDDLEIELRVGEVRVSIALCLEDVREFLHDTIAIRPLSAHWQAPDRFPAAWMDEEPA